MICKNCGFNNNENSMFCTNCGSTIERIPIQNQGVVQNSPIQEQSIQLNDESANISNNMENFQQNQVVQNQDVMQNAHIQDQNKQLNNEAVNISNNMENFQQNQVVQNPSIQEQIVGNNVQLSNTKPQQETLHLNYFFFILSLLLKPVTSIKEELHKFENTKIALIFTAIISGIITVLNLVKKMFSAIYVKGYKGYFGQEATKAKLEWSNLKYLKWGDLIFKNFAIYVGIIVAISLVYYLAGLILKKKVNYKRLLGISSFALIPCIIFCMIVAPLAGKLLTELNIIFMVLGIVYTIAILIYGLNYELDLDEDDRKIYLNVICITLLILVIFYMLTRLLIGNLGLSDLLR